MSHLITALVVWLGLMLGVQFDAIAKTAPTHVARYTPAVSTQHGIPTPEFIVAESGRKTNHQDAQHIIRTVIRESKRARIDPEIVFRIIQIESHYRIRAVSSAGAAGLMQVMPQIHADKIRGRDIFNIDTNIQVGIQIYKQIKARQMAHKDVLQSYAGAPGQTRYSKKFHAVKWSYDPRSKYLVGAVPKEYNETRFFASLGLASAGAPAQPTRVIPQQLLLSVIALNGRY